MPESKSGAFTNLATPLHRWPAEAATTETSILCPCCQRMLRQILACLDLPGARSAAKIHCMRGICANTALPEPVILPCNPRATEPIEGLLHRGAQCLRDALQVVATKVVVCLQQSLKIVALSESRFKAGDAKNFWSRCLPPALTTANAHWAVRWRLSRG